MAVRRAMLYRAGTLTTTKSQCKRMDVTEMDNVEFDVWCHLNQQTKECENQRNCLSGRKFQVIPGEKTVVEY